MVEMYYEMSKEMQELVDLQEEIAEMEEKERKESEKEETKLVLKKKRREFETKRIELGF